MMAVNDPLHIMRHARELLGVRVTQRDDCPLLQGGEGEDIARELPPELTPCSDDDDFGQGAGPLRRWFVLIAL